ncbi:hypothetical protein GHA01_31300 [Novacetimonas hansenii]|uniref:Uncharacterized protein n=1 Tax=Novacetimonas hansenii TaxID=436 RepID=A0ABQ0SIE6_NOVHA|nr:hypothetical protein Gaha_0069_003 [Novacetimonas hansenii JCM 7643]GEC65281.1 hypothetical protein GHA01_31300 [Novacetimonas hansenii]
MQCSVPDPEQDEQLRFPRVYEYLLQDMPVHGYNVEHLDILTAQYNGTLPIWFQSE